MALFSRFVLAFGVNDYSSVIQDPLLIRWSDQESFATWLPAITNQAGSSRTVLKPVNYTAKLYGFRNTVDPNFSYCLDSNYISTFDMASTSGCEKWELFTY